MKKRLLSALLSLLLAFTLLPVSAFAALPQGWWPVWSAYAQAADSGASDDVLLEKGDAVIRFYSAYERSADIASQLFVIYRTRLERAIFENRQDWTRAVENTRTLRDVCAWQIAAGNDPAAYSEWLLRCDAHLAVLEPFTGVYAASYTQRSGYGSRVAAASGTYYGTPHEGGLPERSIFSCYVNLETETAATFAHYIEPLADGKRVLLLNLNFAGEGTTARAIPSGAYDDSLRTTLRYLNALGGPILLRIGGEANVWTDSVTAADFIAAYDYVGRMARSLAPSVELVWSPNYVSAWNVKLADYYPSDALVDWVGLSLYYNYSSVGSAAQEWLEYSHTGPFADPVANAAEAVAVARAKGKPVIATEGGCDLDGGEDYKARKAAKEFSALTMVYPEVKAIVYFDKAIFGDDFRLTGRTLTAVNAAIANNPTLIAHGASSAATYVPLETLGESMSGTLVLGATGRTYRSTDMSVTWALDGRTAATGEQYRVALSSLGSGAHRLDVTFGDGAATTITRTYTLTYANGRVTAAEGWRDPQALPFTDVPASAYYAPAVRWALANGVTTGTSDTTFSPADTCRRGQVVTFLWRAMGKPEPKSTANPFRDVAASDYYYKAVLWAVEQGITNGTSDTTFSPDDTCTTAHILTFLYRAMGRPGNTGAAVWYEDAGAWCAREGLLADTGLSVSPEVNCPRAAVVTCLYRALAA